MGFRSTCYLSVGGTTTKEAITPVLESMLEHYPTDFDDMSYTAVDELFEALEQNTTLTFTEVLDGSPLGFVEELAALGLNCAWACREDMGVDPIVHIYAGEPKAQTFMCDADEAQIALLVRDMRRKDFDPNTYLDAQAVWDGIDGVTFTP